MAATHSWNYNLMLLKEYLTINYNYPKVGEMYKGANLGTWVNNIRTIHNNGIELKDGSFKFGSYILTPNQLNELKNMDFKWTDIRRNTDTFERKFELFKEFLEKYGRYPKQSESYKGINLGAWVSSQRNTFKNGKVLEDGTYIYKSNKLSANHYQMLKEVEFNFDFDRSKTNFYNNYNILLDFIDKYKRYPKSDEKYKGVSIGLWVVRVKRIFNLGHKIENNIIKFDHMMLTQEYIDKLNEIDFRWVENVSYYNKKEIEDSNIYKRKLEYLKLKLNKLLELEKNDIKSMEDVENINKDFAKYLNHSI